MLNMEAYGKGWSPIRGTFGGFGAVDVNDLISQAQEKYGDLLEAVDQPSQELAKDIGEQLAETHGEATGKAAAGEIWTQARPFAIAAIAVLGVIAVAVISKRKK